VLEVPDYAARMRSQLGADWPYYISASTLRRCKQSSDLPAFCASCGLIRQTSEDGFVRCAELLPFKFVVAEATAP